LVHSDIHELMTGAGGATDKEPITVRRARRQSISYDLPPEPEASSDVIALNLESIRLKRKESESVVALLEEVFAEDDVFESVESSEAVEEEERPIASILDESHMRLVLELLRREEIPGARWSEMCREVGLLPGGAIEAINEAVLDAFDDVLIVGSDPVAVEPETAKLLRRLYE